MIIDNLVFEKVFYDKGYIYICGVDEVGCGLLVGLVVVVVVIFEKGFYYEDINDFKILLVKKCEILFEFIK